MLPEPYYQDCHCTIYNADCGEVLPYLDPVDLVLTDPPYDAGTHGKHLSSVSARRSLGFEHMPLEALQAVCNELLRLSRGWVLLTCHWGYVGELPGLVRFGLWIKPNGAPQFTGDRPGTGFEAIAILHKPGRKAWNGGGKHAVWTYPRPNGDHPTQKPLALYKRLISDFLVCEDSHLPVPKRRYILDPFMGSGTALLAAKELGYSAIGIEASREYCDVAIKRLRQETLF